MLHHLFSMHLGSDLVLAVGVYSFTHTPHLCQEQIKPAGKENTGTQPSPYQSAHICQRPARLTNTLVFVSFKLFNLFSYEN